MNDEEYDSFWTSQKRKDRREREAFDRAKFNKIPVSESLMREAEIYYNDYMNSRQIAPINFKFKTLNNSKRANKKALQLFSQAKNMYGRKSQIKRLRRYGFTRNNKYSNNNKSATRSFSKNRRFGKGIRRIGRKFKRNAFGSGRGIKRLASKIAFALAAHDMTRQSGYSRISIGANVCGYFIPSGTTGSNSTGSQVNTMAIDQIANMRLAQGHVSGGTSANQTTYIGKQKWEADIVNQTNGIAKLECYYCSCRNDIPAIADYAPITLLAAGMTGASNGAQTVTTVDSTPFDSPAFCSLYKVYNKKTCILREGEHCKLTLSKNAMRRMNGQDLDPNAFYYRRGGKFILIRAQGLVGNDKNAQANVGEYLVSLDVKVKGEITWTFISDATRTIYSDRATQGAITTAEVITDHIGSDLTVS